MRSDNTQPAETLFPATAIGGTGAQTKTLLTANNGWVRVLAVLLTYVATPSTGGITSPILQAVDAVGNVLWSIPFATIAAGVTAVLEAAGHFPLSTGTPTLQLGPIPNDSWLPPNGKLQLVGTVAASSDTVAAVATCTS